MKRLISLILLSFFFFPFVYGQLPIPSLSINKSPNHYLNNELVKDSVYNLSFFKLKLPIWQGAYTYNKFSLYSVPIEMLYFKNKISFNLKAQINLADEIIPPVNNYNSYSIYPKEFGKSLEGHFTYYFYDEKTKGKVITDAKRSFIKIKPHFTIIDSVDFYRRWGFNFGVVKGVNPYQFIEPFYGNPVSFTTIDKIEITPKQFDSWSFIDYTFLSIGLQYSTLKNFSFETKQFGLKKFSHWQKFNFNLIISLNQKIDNIYHLYEISPNNKVTTEVDVNSTNDQIRLGFMFEYQFMPIENGIIGTFSRVGFLPGLKSNFNPTIESGIFIFLGKRSKRLS